MPAVADFSEKIAELENRTGRVSMKAMSEEIANYKPPQTRIGMIVTWYQWYKTENHHSTPMIAIVEAAKDGLPTINVNVLQDRIMREGVRHVTDPHVKMGMEHVDDGLWDYTEDYRQQTELRHTLERRINDLEGEINKRRGKQAEPPQAG